MDEGDSAIRIGGSTSATTKSKSKLTARDIDGFWLQRLIATVYSDPQTATDKTADALTNLGSESNARDLENNLMDLFDYAHFEIVKQLVENRDRIVWCTRLARASESERMDVEVAMREKGVGWILKELASTTSTSAGKDDMQIDQQEDIPRKLNLAPGSLVKPRQTVDLESMAFSQGARLMSNKKCKLPDGSFKRTKKSYEEIHIPIPPKANFTDKLVQVANMPEWTQQPFKSFPTLNRIQSRLFPVAFHADPDVHDEPLLLCAPTGAGKVSYSPFSYVRTC
jgi:pre-mRNA-splicing helicase BRR2